MITMTTVTEFYGPRLRVQSVVPAAGVAVLAHAWKQLPSRRAFGTVGLVPNPTDNSTGVSAEERRHR